MKRGRIRLEWTELHHTLEEYDMFDDGSAIHLGRAMRNAVERTGVFERSNVVPESIKFIVEKD